MNQMEMKSRYVPVVLTALVLVAGCQAGGADVPTDAIATAQLEYELASTGEVEHNDVHATVPQEVIIDTNQVYYGQRSVRESAALVNFMLGLEVATGAYFAELIQLCEERAAQAEISCPDYLPDEDMTCEEWIQQRREYERLTCLGNEEAPVDAASGRAAMEAVVEFLQAEERSLGADVLPGEIELAQAIADNMTAGGDAPPYRDWGMGGPGYADPDCEAGAGELGATPGGAQDIGFIRKVVEEGYVPLPFHLAVEGLFSEHDLPISGAGRCEQLLCVRAATGLAPTLDTGAPNFFVQIGFSSGLDPKTFRREPLNLAVVLDKSGSMSDMADEELTKMEAVKSALIRMVDRLDADDRLAVVVFESEYEVLLPSTPVFDREGIQALIAGIQAGGGTNIEAGLRQGYEIVASISDQAARMDRVMLLTDALPNVGRTGEDSFLTMAQHYADMGIALTTVGVGFNFGQELALAISQIRGGNYFFLEDADRIAEVFDLDFDYLVTPLAYDLHMEFTPRPAFETVGVYGIPGWTAGQDVVELHVTTVFLGRNRGAIVIRLQNKGTDPI